MADAKISALPALTGANLAAGDLVPVVDVSATTAGSKQMTIDEFLTGILGATCVLDTTYAMASGATFGWSTDALMVRDAADVIAMRRTTNAQAFRTYGTYTDSSNYVRGSFGSSSTEVQINAETAGTGADNVNVTILPAGTGFLKVPNPGTPTNFMALDASAGEVYFQVSVGKAGQFGYGGARLIDSSQYTFSNSGSATTTIDTGIGKAKAGLIKFTNGGSGAGGWATPDAGERTIATGAITVTGSFHTVDTEADAASDDLDTITATSVNDGQFLVLMAENGARTVVVKHNTGNILLNGGTDFSLDNENDTLTLMYATALSKWVMLASSSNGT
jgi:hypothetical protein